MSFKCHLSTSKYYKKFITYFYEIFYNFLYIDGILKLETYCPLKSVKIIIHNKDARLEKVKEKFCNMDRIIAFLFASFDNNF